MLIFLTSALTLDCSDLVQLHAEVNGTWEQHYTVFSINFDAEWSAKNVQDWEYSFGQKGLDSLTLNEYNLLKTNCIINTQLCYRFQIDRACFSNTWLSSTWLTLLKHASVARIFRLFWMYSDFIVLWVLPKQGFKMKGELSAISFQLVALMFARVVIKVM